ncbi:AMP-binding protein [Longispora sp. K20-0274]|uniref:AMP-binding protein n=1 Tax=Longispora sp. K20-0274 TaxID=3088255 RepID=UPI003999D736
MDNYVNRALDILAGYGQREALVGDGVRLTYDDVHAKVLELAASLQDNGVRSGTAVGVLVSNPPEALPLHLALHLLGCRTVWIALITPRNELAAYVQLAQLDVLIYDARTQDALGREIAASLAPLPVLCLGPDGLGPDILAPRAADAPALDLTGVTHEPESVFQTSGTTGLPKMVHHRQGFFEQVIALAGAFRDSGHPVLRHLSVTPPWHVSGPMTAYFNLFHGGVLFVQEDWDADVFLATIHTEQINSTFVSPPLFYELLDHPKLAETDFRQMLMFNVGSAPTAPARLVQAHELLGPVVRIVYGLSESTLISAMPNVTPDPAHPDRLGSCGVPYGDVTIEIRDEDARPVPTGELGEVWVSSKLNMTGYYGQPDYTAETLVDGWVRTGDLGRIDDDGYLYLVDRVKDMIVTGRGSRNVFSRPLEDFLAAQPEIRAAAVIGVGDDKLGEVVHAYVVLAPDATVAVEDLQARILADFTPIWVPRTVDFVDRLPLGNTGKVDKKALRARYRAEHS